MVELYNINSTLPKIISEIKSKLNPMNTPVAYFITRCITNSAVNDDIKWVLGRGYPSVIQTIQ